MNEDQFKSWYQEHQPSHESLKTAAIKILEDLLKRHKIDYFSVTGRVKSVDGVIDKVYRRGIKDPEREIQDFCGIRVITFIEKDVKPVAELVRKCFRIHPEKSADKSIELGTDRMGYRSIHFICDLGKRRLRLPEFVQYKNLVFEVQIRTVLQHAWAEIEHDRGYKSSEGLPSDLKRRLNLIAGLLEIADRELDTLARKIDRYSLSVSRRTDRGNLNVEINSITLTQYLDLKVKELGWPLFPAKTTAEEKDLLVIEAQAFGIKTIKDLDELVTDEFLKACKKRGGPRISYIGLLRLILMFTDIEKFFKLAWGRRWSNMHPMTYKVLIQKYEPRKLNEWLKNLGIGLLVVIGTRRPRLQS
jgi:ppGpp synthetase/RelA/SpoT-type nucleotidyltranferase